MLTIKRKMEIQRPTGEQCESNAKVYEQGGTIGYAIWYPQMGGYVGTAVALFDKEWTEYPHGAAEGGCIDVLVWHDGEFPFGNNGEPPNAIHHCDPEQFIKFGKKLAEINEQGRKIGKNVICSPLNK